MLKILYMVSINEALDIIDSTTEHLLKIEKDISFAGGYCVAEDCISKIDFPPFDQSAMDGYAINNTVECTSFKLVSEIKAGDNGVSFNLKSGEACRIFTGAMIPSGTHIVVKQEDVIVEDGFVNLTKVHTFGENIRLKGEQIKIGQTAVPKFSTLNPGAIGYLAMIGNKKVNVFKKPTISIIATGNELVNLGEDLVLGKIYESNTHTLQAALKEFGFKATSSVVEDNKDAISLAIADGIENSDLLLITGGISVGDYDFVGGILKNQKVEELFYKVRQKPGKPLFFGKKGNTLIFALPGNPAAVLTSFYIYILPVLQKMIGRKTSFLPVKKAKLSGVFDKTPNLGFFMKGFCENDCVSILSAQSSAMLSSFIEANCLIFLEEGKQHWENGDEVQIYMIN